ncbi:MAG: helix-turn-helix domain-containing protein [Sphingomonadales bacterium]
MKALTLADFAESPTEERILAAAYQCFDRRGVGKTSIEEIARTARVSRQTVYRYFSGKDDIIDSICCREAALINIEVRKGVSRSMDFATILTEALFIIVRQGLANKYLRSVLDSTTFQIKAAMNTSRIHQLNRGWWRRFMEQAMGRGELAGDLDLDDVLSWLMTAQSTLQIRFRDGDMTNNEMRWFIRRFFVQPLVTPMKADTAKPRSANHRATP